MFRWRSSGLSAVSFEAGLSLWFQHSAISSHYSQHSRVGVSGGSRARITSTKTSETTRLRVVSEDSVEVWGEGRVGQGPRAPAL